MIQRQPEIGPQCIERAEHTTGGCQRAIHLRTQKRPQALEGIGVKLQIGIQ